MSKILVSPSHLEEVAALFVNQRKELEQMCRKLDEQIHFVQSNWSGATRERFFEEYRTARETIKVTFEQISAIGQQLLFIAREFKRVDGEQEVIQYPDDAIFKGVYDSLTGTYNDIKTTGYSFLEHPFKTTLDIGIGLTFGRVIDAGRVIGFSWDYLWGTGTARKDYDEFVAKVNQDIEENGLGYYSTYAVTQAATYFLVGKALRKSDAKHDDLGGAGTKKDGDKAGAKGNVNLTEPSLPKGGKPKGNYTKGGSHGIKKESETADLMAGQGYDIEMLDEVNGGNKYGIKESSNPDFLIEGKVFDCYAPTIDTNVDNLLRNLTKKTKTQAERIVLNLDQFPSEKVYEITQGILRKANPNGDLKNLKELLIVKDGEITRVFGG